MIVIDTSVLVRFFTKDNLPAFKKVEKLLSSSEELFISDVVFVELEYVLGKLYSASREEIAKAYQFLVGGRFVTSREAVSASLLFSKKSLSMADCFLAVHGQKGKLASFDKKLLNSSGCVAYWTI